jgi:hypothetical protein
VLVCARCLAGGMRKLQLPKVAAANGMGRPRLVPEMAALNAIEKMLVQRVKAFQHVLLLQSVTGKGAAVPAVKGLGTILHLPTDPTLRSVSLDHSLTGVSWPLTRIWGIDAGMWRRRPSHCRRASR